MGVVSALGAALLAAAPGLAAASVALELPTFDFPRTGTDAPHTYVGDPAKITCSPLHPYPSTASMPYAPTVDQARAFCSGLEHCGGFLFLTSQAAGAQSPPLYVTQATYCKPQTFATGVPSSTSSVGFVRFMYQKCDRAVNLSTSTATFHGSLVSTRQACVRMGRGLTPFRTRSPVPSHGPAYRRPERPSVLLGGKAYEVGRQAFITSEEAKNASADGTAHSSAAANGAVYHLPGSSPATMVQSMMPFALDGFYPLYTAEEAAQAASSTGGGQGVAVQVGPGSAAFSSANKMWWADIPRDASYYMPQSGPTLYFGDYRGAFSLDGYFPLYETMSEAQKASSGGQAQSHGPQSSTGHPQAWSTGRFQMYWMPADGTEQYYGNYLKTLPYPGVGGGSYTYYGSSGGGLPSAGNGGTGTGGAGNLPGGCSLYKTALGNGAGNSPGDGGAGAEAQAQYEPISAIAGDGLEARAAAQAVVLGAQLAHMTGINAALGLASTWEPGTSPPYSPALSTP